MGDSDAEREVKQQAPRPPPASIFTSSAKNFLFFSFSTKMAAAAPAAPPANRFLVFGGKTGWIGQKLVSMLREAGKDVVVANTRLENIQDVAAEIDAVKPTHVFNAAGLTGRPNVDWCEDHKDEVIRVNVVGTLGLLDACETRKIHCTNFATG